LSIGSRVHPAAIQEGWFVKRVVGLEWIGLKINLPLRLV
jgi:hypothetical protein